MTDSFSAPQQHHKQQQQKQEEESRRLEELAPRSYLDSTVVPTLLEGLKAVVLER